MPSHLSAIGFAVQSQEEMEALVARAVDEGEPCRCSLGYYVRWSPGSGVELWAQVDREGTLVGFNPHFDGPSHLRAFIRQDLRDLDFPLDGSLLCEPHEEHGAPPFVIDLPDADLALSALTGPALATLQVAAFAHGLRCFADEAAFRASQEGEAPPYAAACFIPAGVSVHGEEDRPRADAFFAGRVLAAERLANPVTGQPFWAMTVRTLIGDLTVVADPDGMEGEPAVDGIVDGTCWLSARLVSVA